MENFTPEDTLQNKFFRYFNNYNSDLSPEQQDQPTALHSHLTNPLQEAEISPFSKTPSPSLSNKKPDYRLSENRMPAQEIPFREQRYDFSNEIQVNFSETESATDIMPAEACIEVFTSDGKKGTINHLYRIHKAEEFAGDLRSRLGDSTNISVCVAGAWSLYPDSIAKAEMIIQALNNQGFIISDTDIGGNYSRLGTIFTDRVKLYRKKLGTNEEEVIELRF